MVDGIVINNAGSNNYNSVILGNLLMNTSNE